MRRWGYRHVITPLVESMEVLDLGLGSEQRRRLFKFTDAHGDVVALVGERTVPVARLVAGKPSFPMRRKREVEFRPYTKESLLTREVEVFPVDEEEAEALVETPSGDEDVEEGMHEVEDEGEAIDFSDEADAEAEDEDEDEG